MANDLVAEFEEFLRQRDAKKRKAGRKNEDVECVTIWDEKGCAARVPRSDAKDWLKDHFDIETKETAKDSDNDDDETDDDETDESDDDAASSRRRPGPAHRHGRADADVFRIGEDDE